MYLKFDPECPRTTQPHYICIFQSGGYSQYRIGERTPFKIEKFLSMA